MNPVAQQRLLYQQVWLVTAASGRTHLRSLDERHSQEAASQLSHDLDLQLGTAASGGTHLRSLGKRHSQGAASQLSHDHFLQLVTKGSNCEFNREFMYLRLRRTYSLQ
jgi:hypothetical protein